MIISYIYCLPKSENQMFYVVINSILMSTSGLMIIFLAKMPKWLGLSKIYNYFGIFYLPLPFLFSVPMTLVTIICTVKIFLNKDFNYSVTILPTLVIIYSSYKAYYTYKLEKSSLEG